MKELAAGETGTYNVPDDAIAIDIIIRGGVGEDGDDGFERPAAENQSEYITYPPGGTGGAGGYAVARVYGVGGETLTGEVGVNGANGGSGPAGDGGDPGSNTYGQGGRGAAPSRVTDSSGTELVAAGGGGGGGGGGYYNWVADTYPKYPTREAGGCGGGGGGRGGAGGSGYASGQTGDPDDPDWVWTPGDGGSSGSGSGVGGDGGSGGAPTTSGGDGGNGGVASSPDTILLTESVSREGPHIEFRPLYYPRGEPQSFSPGQTTTYTPPENTRALDIDLRGGTGTDGDPSYMKGGPGAEGYMQSGGNGGAGGHVLARVPIEQQQEQFRVDVGQNGAGAPGGQGDGGGDGGDGGTPSALTRIRDDTEIAAGGGGGGGGGADTYVMSYSYRIYERDGAGGGGGVPGGQGGSGSGDATAGSDAGGTGSIGGNGGNTESSGQAGATRTHSTLKPAKDGFVTDGTSTDGAEITITPVFNPDRPPANLTATPTGEGTVSLSWDDKSSSETQFNVYRGTSKGDLSKIGSTAANTTTYADSTVEVGTYYYAVTFVNDIRESPKSNTASATVGDLVNVWTGDAWEQKVLYYYDGNQWVAADNIEPQ